MTYRELLSEGENILKNSNIQDYKTDAFYLLEYVFNMNRSSFFLKGNESIEDNQTGKIKEYFDKIDIRKNHTPLQHITNCQEFMGLSFYVDENVLIPRQDTEILVEKAIEICNGIDIGNTDGNKVRVLDMCTGSGCIAVSLAKLCKNTMVTAVDLSDKALEVAVINAKNNEADINFKESDLFTSLSETLFDIIVSNPPYIKTGDIENLMEEVKFNEPFMALDGSEDGLKFYRRITEESVKYLRAGGYLVYEIGYDQAVEVRAIMESNGFDDIEIIKDLAGLDRVVCGRLDNGGNRRCLIN